MKSLNPGQLSAAVAVRFIIGGAAFAHEGH